MHHMSALLPFLLAVSGEPEAVPSDYVSHDPFSVVGYLPEWRYLQWTAEEFVQPYHPRLMFNLIELT